MTTDVVNRTWQISHAGPLFWPIALPRSFIFYPILEVVKLSRTSLKYFLDFLCTVYLYVSTPKYNRSLLGARWTCGWWDGQSPISSHKDAEYPLGLAVLKHKRDEIWAAAYAENASTKHSWLSDRVVNYNQRQTEMRREADVCSDFVQECLTNKHETIIKEAFELCFP